MTERPDDLDTSPAAELGGGQELVDDAVAEVRAEARDEATAAARHEFWHFYWPRRVVPVVAVLTLLFSVGASWLLSSRQDATDAAISILRDQANQAKEAGDKANEQLAARGQAIVPIPQPGQAPDTEVIVSAATARVLASLPSLQPTAAELGGAVAQYLAANPVTPAGPSPSEIAATLAGYLATNPPPSGPRGESGAPGQPGEGGPQGPKGDKGDPPTAEEIQAALAQYVRDNPDVLCPRGGSFAQLRVQLVDGGSADTYACVVATNPPAPPTSDSPVLPIPTN